MKLEDVILIDTRANQPAATSVAVGTLYSVTDEDNIVERSNGTIWVTYANSGGGGSGAMPPIVFRPQDNEPPTATFATLDTRNTHPVLDFDAATDESAVFSGFLPAAYAGGGLTITCFWTATSATSGDLLCDVSIERDDLAGIDIDSDSFAAVVSDAGTAPGTSGQIFVTIHVFTSGAAMDGLLAGELFRIKVTRDANGGGDTMTGDGELLRVVVKET